MTSSTSAVAVCWSNDFGEFGGAVGDPLFEIGVGFLEVCRHPVEITGKTLQLVAGVDVDTAVEFAGTDARGAGLQLARIGPVMRRASNNVGQRREDKRHNQQPRSA